MRLFRRSRCKLVSLFAGLLMATAVSCGGGVQAAAIHNAAMQASVLPASASVVAGATQTFTATFGPGVAASEMAAVQWHVTGGTIQLDPPSGNTESATFTAGGSAGNFSLTLTDDSGAAVAAAVIAVTAAPLPPAVTATLSPASLSLQTGASAAVTATVANADPATLVWSATGGSMAQGTVSGQTVAATFTAGATPGTYAVSVAAAAGGSPLATLAVTVTAPPPPPPPVTATLAPATLNVQTGATATVTATVANTDPSLLAWSATGGTIAAGSVSGQTVAATYTAGNTAGSFAITVAASAGGAPLATTAVTVTAPPPPTGPPAGARLFPDASADWLYSAPTGTGLNISSVTASLTISLNDHVGGFDYPVQTTDGTHGCTTFTDTLQYAYTDKICVPNPANGYFPSVGGYGANDGHLVVMDTANGQYYDFWKLYTSNGTPKSTNVGAIVQGSLNGNGTPGTTAALITGIAGDIMPGELDCDTCLNHALSVTVPGGMNSNLKGTQAPVTHTDGSVSGAVFREGAKIRFDPSIDVSSLNASTAAKAILRALQLYGGVITDQSGGTGFGLYTDLAAAPDTSGLSQACQHIFIYY